MGHTIAEWRTRVAAILRDTTNQDLDVSQIDDVCIAPALAQYSVDRPYLRTTEAAGAGSAYLDLPDGWSTGFSRLHAVEHPARDNPPTFLDEQSWQLVRSVADVDVEQILLDRSPTASEYVRLTFTAPWPTPTETAGDDKVDDVAFHAVTHLAASFGCIHLAAEASRDRAGALPTNIVQGRERAQALRDEADRLGSVYNSFLGLVTGDGAGGGGGATAPVSRRFDYDPGRTSLFHGGRR